MALNCKLTIDGIRQILDNNKILVKDNKGIECTVIEAVKSYLNYLIKVNDLVHFTDDLNHNINALNNVFQPNVSFFSLLEEQEEQEEQVPLESIKCLLSCALSISRQEAEINVSKNINNSTLLKIITLIGKLVNYDCYLNNSQQSFYIDLPKHFLQYSLLLFTHQLITNINLSNYHLRQLALNFSPAFAYFEMEHMDLLFYAVCTKISCLLLSESEEILNEHSPAIEINSTPIESNINYKSYVFYILRDISSRFNTLDNLFEAIPNFKMWMQINLILDNYTTIYSLQHLLTQNNVNLKLILQIFNLINSSWTGHATPLIENQECTTCELIPYIMSKGINNCVKCKQKIDKIGLKCLGCKMQLHIKCGNQIKSNNSLNRFYNTTSLNTIMTDNEVKFIRITTIQTEICFKCNKPMFGICLQAALCFNDLKVYHLECITNNQSPPTLYNNIGIPIELEEYLNQKNQKNQKSQLNSLEYLILKDYLEIQLELFNHSDVQFIRDLCNEFNNVLFKLSNMFTSSSNSNLSTSSILFNYDQLRNFIFNLKFLNDSQSDIRFIDHNINPFNYNTFIESFNYSNFNYAFFKYIIMNYFEVHGLINVYSTIDKQLSINNLLISLPFSMDQIFIYDSKLNSKILNNLFNTNDLDLIIYAFHLLDRLPQVNLLESNMFNDILYLIIKFILFNDEMPTTLIYDNEEYKFKYNQILTNYSLPWIINSFKNFEDDQLYGQLFYNQLILSYNNDQQPFNLLDYENILELIIKLKHIGLPEDIWINILDHWTFNLCLIIEYNYSEDSSNIIKRLLVNQLKGIIINDMDNFLNNQNLNNNFNSALILKESFLFQLCFKNVALDHLAPTNTLNWLLLISYSNFLIPDFNEIILQVSYNSLSTIKDFNLLLKILIDQIILDEAKMSSSFLRILEFLNYQIFKPSFQSLLLSDDEDVKQFVQLSIIVSLIITGNLNTLQQESNEFDIKLRTRILDIKFNIPISDMILIHFKKFLIKLVAILNPTLCGLPILIMYKIILLDNKELKWLMDKSLIIKLWELLSPELGLLTSKLVNIVMFVGSSNSNFLLECILLDSNVHWEIQWQWMDSCFGLLSYFNLILDNTNSNQFKDIYKFLGPIVNAFINTSLFPKETLRTKFETLAKSLEFKNLNQILKVWELYFSLSNVDQKLITIKLMIHLNTLFPKWQVIKWSTLSSSIQQLQIEDNLNVTNDNDAQIHSKIISLKIQIFSLFFQLIINQIPIYKKDIFTFKFLLARNIGMHEARLEANNLECFVVLANVNIDLKDKNNVYLIQSILNHFKHLFDNKICFIDNDNNENTHQPNDNDNDNLISVLFIDLFLTIFNSNINLIELPNPMFMDIIESILILIYKIEIEKLPYFDMLIQLLIKLNSYLDNNLTQMYALALINLNHTILRRTPKLAQSVLMFTIIPIALIAVNNNSNNNSNNQHNAKYKGMDQLTFKARAFLNFVFHTYSSNGLFTIIFKNYDYKKYNETLFKALIVTLGRDIKDINNETSLKIRIQNEATYFSLPIYDVINHVTTFQESDYKSFKVVLNNLTRYILKVYYSKYDEKLLDLILSQFPQLLFKLVQKWNSKHFDLSNMFIILECVIRNNKRITEDVGNNIYYFIDSIIHLFNFKSISLRMLLETLTYYYTNKNKLDDIVKFGSTIFEGLNYVIIHKNEYNLYDHIINYCLVIFHKEEQNFRNNENLIQYIDKDHHPFNTLNEMITYIQHHANFYVPFQKVPSNLFFNLIHYLDDYNNFKKDNPNSFKAGLWIGHLTAVIYTEKFINYSAVLEWLRNNDSKASILSKVWFILSLYNLKGINHLLFISSFQPIILNLISQILNQPFNSNQSNTLIYNIAYPSQNLKLALFLAKIWIALLSKLEEFSELNHTVSSTNLETIDPYYNVSLQSAFWFSLWPAILDNLIPDSISPNIDTDKQFVLIELFADLIPFLNKCYTSVFPTNLLPEWYDFFIQFSKLAPSIAKNHDYQLALKILKKEQIVKPLSQNQIISLLLEQFNDILFN